MNEEQLGELLRERLAQHGIVGAALAVLDKGDETIATAGVADAASAEPVTTETRFALGSLTKSMMATVFARLDEAGRLTLDDRVSLHVPEVRGTRWGEDATL